MKISLSISAMGLSWKWWKQITLYIEEMGFSSVFRGDHFPFGSQPTTEVLELITSLTYFADHTKQVDFGSLVAPLSFHDPVMLSRQALNLNELSGGRMILGVGTGWQEQEHTRFGYKLGDLKTCTKRLEEGLEVIQLLTRSVEPISFQGQFYQLKGACLLSNPQLRPRILIGGKSLKRVLPLVARHADIWNCEGVSPELFQQLSGHLDEMLIAQGRAPGEVIRSITIPVLCYRNSGDKQDAFNFARKIPLLSSASDEDLQEMFASSNGILGGPDEVIEKLQLYAKAGVEEFVILWFWVGYLDGLQIIAREILPRFTADQQESRV